MATNMTSSFSKRERSVKILTSPAQIQSRLREKFNLAPKDPTTRCGHSDGQGSAARRIAQSRRVQAGPERFLSV